MTIYFYLHIFLKNSQNLYTIFKLVTVSYINVPCHFITTLITPRTTSQGPL